MDKSSFKAQIIFCGVLILVVVLWYGLGFLLTLVYYPTLPENIGTFGDGFGSVNALFSGLAFAGIIYSIIIQQQEIVETKRLMHLQQFESSFFQMLSNLKNTVDAIETRMQIIQDDGTFIWVRLKGKNSFEAYNRIIYGDNFQLRTYEDSCDYYRNAEVTPPFDSYHITLALLLKYIEDSGLTREQKLLYFNLVIQPMIFKQKIALFYHIGINEGRANEFDQILRDVETKYILLKNLPKLERIASSYNLIFLHQAGIYTEELPWDFPIWQFQAHPTKAKLQVHPSLI